MAREKTLDQYTVEIKELHSQLKEYPDNETLQKKLNARLSEWAKRISITIFQAQNEQTPWLQEDLGYPVRPMLLKDKTGLDQVGDYQAYYQGSGFAGWIGILIERKGGKKGCEDLYSTLMGSENCSRFYREIERFQKDDRFTQMIIIAECSLNDFLLYTPLFNGNVRNVNHVGASVEAKRGKIASLYSRGIPVLFSGTRKNAVELYRGLIRQWLIKNYSKVLSLDVEPYNDSTALLKRKALLEVELQAVNASLKKYEVPA